MGRLSRGETALGADASAAALRSLLSAGRAGRRPLTPARSLVVSSKVAPHPAEPDVTEQIAKLAALRDQGALTEDEFAAKKAELLGRI